MVLKIAIEKVSKYWSNNKILAYTIPDNIASIKSLEKAGFHFNSSTNNKNCYIFLKINLK